MISLYEETICDIYLNLAKFCAALISNSVMKKVNDRCCANSG